MKKYIYLSLSTQDSKRLNTLLKKKLLSKGLISAKFAGRSVGFNDVIIRTSEGYPLAKAMTLSRSGVGAAMVQMSVSSLCNSPIIPSNFPSVGTPHCFSLCSCISYLLTHGSKFRIFFYYYYLVTVNFVFIHCHPCFGEIKRGNIRLNFDLALKPILRKLGE